MAVSPKFREPVVSKFDERLAALLDMSVSRPLEKMVGAVEALTVPVGLSKLFWTWSKDRRLRPQPVAPAAARQATPIHAYLVMVLM